jgi:integrase
MWISRGAEMLRHDLTAAGLPYQDANGLFYDFHSLRSVTPTLMARNGVPLSAAQHHLGHHDFKTTHKFYTKHTLRSQAVEQAKIPSYAPRMESPPSTTPVTPSDPGDVPPESRHPNEPT